MPQVKNKKINKKKQKGYLFEVLSKMNGSDLTKLKLMTVEVYSW